MLFDDPPGRTRFARADPEEAAAKLAALLADEQADLLLSYDRHGGSGHRDHVRVHQVGKRAAGLAGVRVVEATVPRELVARLARPLLLFRLLTRHRLEEMRGVRHAAGCDHAPGRRPPPRGAKAGRPGGALPAGPGPAPAGPAAPRAGQMPRAGVPHRLRNRVVRRAGGTYGRTSRRAGRARPPFMITEG